MTDSRHAHTAPWHPVLFALIAAALMLAAAFVMFSAFMYYDDEGYVLISLKNFAEHGGLYRDVYSQYGPFPFVFYSAIHELGLPLTHFTGRMVTLAAWTAAAVLGGSLVRQGTRSFSLAVAVLAAVFAYLWVMANEPTHPGGLIVMITMVMGAVGYRWLLLGRIGRWAILTAAGAAMLILTKINVGGLAALSVLAWMLLHARNDYVRRWAPGLLAAAAVLVTVVLMRPLLALPWVQTYAIVFACSAVAAVAAAARAGHALLGMREFGGSIAAGVVVAAAVIGVVMVRGTSIGELVDGVLLAPLRHPAIFSVPFTWAPGAGAFAVGSALGCAASLILHRRHPERIDRGVAVLRVAVAVALAIALLRFPSAVPDRMVFAYGAPCVWLFLWPLAGESHRSASARTWVGLLALGQVLHAFPVAGSQIAWGTVLMLPLGALGAAEALAWLGERLAPARQQHAHRTMLMLRAAVWGLALVLGLKFAQVATRYREGSVFTLPGAELLRLPSHSAAAYRLLTLNAAAHADVLFSEPGMFSFNLWTDLPTPTLANATHWFSLLPAAQQQEIMAVLESHPRACVIVQQSHMDFLRQRGFEPAGPLHDYITRQFKPAFSIDGFDFCVHRDRTIEPLMLGELLVNSSAGAGIENMAVRLRLLLPPGKAVARIELTSAEPARAAALSLHAGSARLEAAPTDVRGTRLGPATAMTWPLRLHGPAMVTAYFDRFAHPHPLPGGLIRLLDASGTEVALARLDETSAGPDLAATARN